MNAQGKARESCGTHIPLLALALFCLIGIASPTTLSGCGYLNGAGGSFILNQTITNLTNTCLTVNASNIIINCNGFSITGGNASASYGIYSTMSNTTVKNCNIRDFETGIYYNTASGGLITNTSSVMVAGGNSYGVYLKTCANNTIQHSTISSGTNVALFLSAANTNILNNLTLSSTASTSLFLSNSGSNVLANSSLSSSYASGQIWHLSGNNNNFTNNVINGKASALGITLAGSGHTLINNTIMNATTLLAISASGSVLCLNNFSNTGTSIPTAYVSDTNGGNFYNCTYNGTNQGNIYGNVMNKSVFVYGTTASNIPSLYVGSNLNYTNVTSLGKFSCNFAGCQDNAPLTDLIPTFKSTFSNPQYDLINDNLTLSVSFGASTLGAMSSNVTYNGTTYSVDCTLTGNNYTCSKVVTPPAVTVITSMAINWSFALPLISYTNTTNNATDLYPSGLIYCGNLSNSTSLNISIRDIQTNAMIPTSIISMITTYTGSSKVSSFGSTNSSNLTLCILPNTTTFSTSNTILVTATGYYQNSLVDAFSVSGTQTNKTYYLLNTSNAYTTVLKVITSPNLLTNGVKISIYSYTAPSTYLLTSSCTTDAGGQCSIYLQTGIQQYVYNFTSGGQNYTFGPEILSCTGTTCYRTFTIGSAGSIPIALTGALSGACSYTNTTRIAQCTGTDTSSTLTSFTLVANPLGNQTPVCNTTSVGSSATIICTLPDVCGLYAITFYGNDGSGNTYSLSGATVTTSACSTTTGYGREGWIALLILFGTIALIGSYNIAVSMTLGAAGLFLGLLLGIIPFDMNLVIFVSIAIMGDILAYRSKV